MRFAPTHPTLPPTHSPDCAGWELEGTLCEAANTDTGVVWECPLLVPLDPVARALRAPSRREAPRWLRAPLERGSSVDTSGTFGSFDRPGGGLDRSGSTPHLERAARAVVEAAAAGPSSSVAGGAPPFAFHSHQPTDSFAFSEASKSLAANHSEAASSAVHAWQQQPAEAEAAAADADAPSDAAALPPGRRGRRPVEGARLSLQSAATLEDWSQPTSEQPSPEPSRSSAASPQKGSPAPAPAAARPRPPLLRLPGGGAVPEAQQARLQEGRGEGEEEEDRFAAAFTRLSMRGIRARKLSADRGASRRGSQAVLAGGGEDGEVDGVPDTPPAPERQWHFFTSEPGRGRAPQSVCAVAGRGGGGTIIVSCALAGASPAAPPAGLH